jgi:hypothetical protein
MEITMRGVIGVLLVSVTALVAGFIGYQAGVSSSVASSVAASAGTVVYHAAWGFGVPWLGFLFFPFFLFLLFGLFAFAFGGRRRWGAGPGGPGWGYGNGGYPGRDDPRYRWVADAHRRLHDDEAASGTTQAATQRTAAHGTPPAPPTDRPQAG